MGARDPARGSTMAGTASEASACTNTNTHFFREAEVIASVRQHFLARHPAEGGAPSRPLSLWCAACSTGDEAYSLAIAACQVGADAEILATDINVQALQHAERGHYGPWSLRHVGGELRKRWFVPEGDGAFSVAPKPRRLVSFRRHDLLGPTAPAPRAGSSRATPGWDLIFCRNILIYFEPPAVEHIVGLLASALAPSGILVLGASERLPAHLRARMGLELSRLDDVFVYRKVSAPGALVAHGATPPKARRDAASPAREPPPGSGRPRVEPLKQSSSSRRSSANLLETGDLLFDRRDLAGAMGAYRRAATQTPLWAELHLRIGICSIELGEMSEAYEALRRSLFLAPDLWPAAFLLGDLAAARDDATAMRYFVQARASLLALEPTPPHDALARRIQCGKIGILDPLASPQAALEALERRLATKGVRRR